LFYNDGTTPLNSMQLFSVDPVTAEATPIGDGSGSNVQSSAVTYSSSCNSEPAWNPVTQTAYFGAYTKLGGAPAGDNFLMTVDLEIGESTEVGAFTGFETAPAACGTNFQSLAIGGDGSAFVFDSNACMYSLDLSSAQVTFIGGVANGDAGRYYPQAWSPDQATQVWQALDNEDGFLSTVDVTTGNLSVSGPTVTFGTDGYDPQSLEFDSTGRGWVLNDVAGPPGSGSSTTNVYTLNPASGAVTLVGEPFTDADGAFTSTALLITKPVAQLPNTGLSESTVWIWVIGGSAFLTAGIALGVIRRRLI
jgi:LPXTG-motif cell wall-anchored protein